MTWVDVFIIGGAIYAVLQIGGLIWLDAKHGPKAGAREERGHGIVYSDMDRG
jgi:hypothetical protein